MILSSRNLIKKKYLDINNYNYSLEKGVFRIVAKDKKACKQSIIKFIYENEIELNLFKEEMITLEKLYQQVMEDKENESTIV